MSLQMPVRRLLCIGETPEDKYSLLWSCFIGVIMHKTSSPIRKAHWHVKSLWRVHVFSPVRSCTGVPFWDFTGPTGRWALPPWLLHAGLQKAVLLGGAHKPAMALIDWEFNYTGVQPSECVLPLTSCRPPHLPLVTEAQRCEVTDSKYPEAGCFHAC